LLAGIALGVLADRAVSARSSAATPPAPAAVAPAAPPPPAAAAAAAKIPLRADDAVRGPEAAKVTIALFSDFQCPFCARVEPTLKALQAAYPGAVRLDWRHLPLPFHPNALPAAKASEAAREQGKFWEMHDRLFEEQASLSDALYARTAKELGLDLKRFERDAAGERISKRIAEDQALAAAVGASGTPTLFVNCRKMVGAQPVEAFKPVVEEEIKKADALLAKGVKPGAALYERLCADNVAAAPPEVAAAPPRAKVDVTVRPDDPLRGNRKAAVTVVMFSDFQCPFCARAVPAVKSVEATHGDRVRIVWKHLPLSMHQNAMPAALAAEAAREQGKFWEMHDKLFSDQAALSPATYERYARELGLDLPRFKAAMLAPATSQRVIQDAQLAGAAGVNGTPTFVVDGELVIGSPGLESAVQRHLGARAGR
jgi:protein-disulfide isomerase